MSEGVTCPCNATVVTPSLRRRKEKNDYMALPYIDIALPGIPPYRLMHVPGGEFLMGADEADTEAQDREKPAHRVRLDDFYIGRFPVTQDLWEAVMRENPSRFKGPRRPVETVSWNDITEQFLPRLQETTGGRYRLPTEAEWEYAARGGPFWKEEDFRYAGSEVLQQVGWYDENSGDATRDVGLLLPNALGLYDMSGNVWEWCADDWHSDYNGAPTDGSAWVDSPERGSRRVLRGGSWSNSAVRCRVSYRIISDPVNRNGDFGFRVVLFP